MLRQRGLRQANAWLELPDRQFAIGQLAQDHQAPFVAEQPQQRYGPAGTSFEHGEIKLSKIEHASNICIDSKLASTNIML